ncbi:MAG: hypothetical protein ACYTG6_06860 [Planctomycetota bacterium]|jgi:hypothetical protein
MRQNPALHPIPPARTPDAIDLHLTVGDPAVVAELAALPEGRARDELALSALRIGVLALQQARGRIDAETVRNEGALLLKDLAANLREHQQKVSEHLAGSLREYFDPEGGRFTERVERLVRKDGELEQVLRRQIGREDSELAETLASHFGAQSPLMKALSPDESSGILRSLTETLENVLHQNSEGILREFSLDHKESALNRLVGELTERHGKLAEGLQGSVEKVVGEFSLDNEESALSRLVGRVERAQQQISREFTLDEESSALARMRRELLEVLETHKKASTDFQQEVKTALAEMQTRRKEAERSTTHGLDFEAEVSRVLARESQAQHDVLTDASNTTGLIKNCKVGDFVVEMGPESSAAGARIVVEAKESAAYDLAKAREEMETARKNRGAEIGLFVFSERTAPAEMRPLIRLGRDVFVRWDASDAASDVVLLAGLSVAKALSTRLSDERARQDADFESIERAIRAVEKLADGLDQIKKAAETIQGSSGKVLDRVRIMTNELTRQVRALDEGFADLKTSFEADGEPA